MTSSEWCKYDKQFLSEALDIDKIVVSFFLLFLGSEHYAYCLITYDNSTIVPIPYQTIPWQEL